LGGEHTEALSKFNPLSAVVLIGGQWGFKDGGEEQRLA
jgi:hypothetical protein